MFLEEVLGIMLAGDESTPLMQLVQGRIYNPVLPPHLQDFPALAYRLIKTDSDDILEPPGVADLSRQRFRFFSTAKGLGKYTDARRTAEAVEQQIQGFRGVVSNDASPADSIQIQGIFHINTLALYDDLTETHSVVSDFDIWSQPA